MAATMRLVFFGLDELEREYAEKERKMRLRLKPKLRKLALSVKKDARGSCCSFSTKVTKTSGVLGFSDFLQLKNVHNPAASTTKQMNHFFILSSVLI